MKNNFLLITRTGTELYHAVKDFPIIDFHNHLSMEDLAVNRQFENLTELWVANDPYKHRAMRICGVEEHLITGKAGCYEKFAAWARTVPRLPGNPLYHWTMLELERVLDIGTGLTEKNAESVWTQGNDLLKRPGYSARGLLERFQVEYAAPCVSLADDLAPFGKMTNVVPSLRGDNLIALSEEITEFLGKISGKPITGLDDYSQALSLRLDEFHRAGCRFADHSLDSGFSYKPDDEKNPERFAKFLRHEPIDAEDRIHLESALLRILGGNYARRNWVCQLHIGALRHTSDRLRKLAGPAGGYAGIAHCCDLESLTRLLNGLERNPEGLPRTILYTLNPADQAALAVLSGSFTEDRISGKVQLGPAWWFCDHLTGIRECLEIQSAFGVLSTFIGMTTDSRSLLSFVRYEYFRRIFCSWLGEKAERDEFPGEIDQLKELAGAVCYKNAKNLIQNLKG